MVPAFLPSQTLPPLRRSSSAQFSVGSSRLSAPAACAAKPPAHPPSNLPGSPPSQGITPSPVSRALSQRRETLTHASALRDTLVTRIAAAAAEAVAGDVANELAAAVAAAADARAASAAARSLLAGTRDSAIGVRIMMEEKARIEGERVRDLEGKVKFLEARLREKESAIEAKNDKSGIEGKPVRVVSSIKASPCSCASDARMCLSGLLMYPSLSGADPSTNQAPPSSSPAFPSALLQYLDALLLAPSSPAASLRASATTAYANLWRTVALGNCGWRGEVIRAAVTLAQPELLAIAQSSPELRRGLATDLGKLQRLAETPVEEVNAWLGGAAEGTIALPECSDAIEIEHNVKAEVDYGEIAAVLESSSDWGSDLVVQAILDNALNGPSQASSLADKYFGLRWHPQGYLEGLLSREDVQDMPAYQFVGVGHVRRRLSQQVEFLLNSLPTSNVLLWGPPGTGKSSCVSSLLRDFGPRGLRVIEVTKETLGMLPDIFAIIQRLPQKFCIFIDDLSFEEHESEAMRVAKAALEGSLRKYPSNSFVVVTSNRRYPVGSRITDATEEKMAFTMRFGVVLSFPRMSRKTYLQVVHKLCDDCGVVMAREEMDQLALAWALGQDGNSSNSLSGRTARQFAEHVSSCQALSALTGEEPEYLASAGNTNANSVAANSLWANEGAAHIQR